MNRNSLNNCFFFAFKAGISYNYKEMEVMMMKQQAMFKNMSNEPLANRLRPTTLTEYVGQRHLIGPGKILYQLINSDVDRKSTRLNSSHSRASRMPSSA